MPAPYPARMSPPRWWGFTLIEMVVVILLLGIIGAGVAAFLVRPVEGYRDLARRAALVDVAETSLRRLERDIRAALPRSVRVTNLSGGGFAVETLPIIEGVMYRRNDNSGGTTGNFNRLFLNNADDFDIHKFLRHVAVPSSSTTHRLVLNNTATTTNNNAYTAPAIDNTVITPPGTVITYSATGLSTGGSPAHHINVSPTYDFLTYSVRQRIYIIETPVTYLCTPDATNPALGTLIRYEGYVIVAAQPSSSGVAPLATAASARIVDNVVACTFNTSTVDTRNRAMVTLTLTLEDDGERVRLLHQVQLDNSP